MKAFSISTSRGWLFLQALLVLVLGLRCPIAWSEELKAGAVRVEITPPVGHQLWGLASRVGPSTGVLDPLYARVLVLKSSHSSLALVALDLGRTFDAMHMADLRARVKSDFGIEHVIFSASHTHNGPTLLDKKYIQTGSNRWEPRALDSIARAIGEANLKAVPCYIGAAKGSASVGQNRQDPAGGLWTNEIRHPNYPRDPVVQVLRVSEPGGKVTAVVVNYAAHPVVLDSDNSTEYSADFPGAMASYVEKNLPGAVCLFVQGACGDINPRYVGQYPSTERGPGYYGVLVHEMRQTGRELGHEVLRVANGIQLARSQHAELLVRDEELTFKSRWDIGKLKALQAVPTYHQWAVEGRPIGYPPEQLTVLITSVLINRQIAMLTMPGEPYVEHQISFRDRLPGLDTILAGYANGYLGYIPTIRIAARDGVVYGGNAWPTILEVGAGERIVDRGIVNVYRMLGRLKDKPDQAARAAEN
jgi:neutral ceramidase